jgi:peptidyl-tRNA hydrolase, PTH1 family
MSEGSVLLDRSETEIDEASTEAQVRTCCIAGLGNPGVRYRDTPHNIGFKVVDELARRHSVCVSKHDRLAAAAGTGKVRNKDVVLVKPQTFMNNSGAGVRAILECRALTNSDLILVYDELDLPWTALRIKRNGSAAGHNGVKSVIAALKTDVFIRVRVGIRPRHPIDDAAGFVLAPFEREMKDDVDEVVSYTADAVESVVAEGAVKAMAKFNRSARGIQEEE